MLSRISRNTLRAVAPNHRLRAAGLPRFKYSTLPRRSEYYAAFYGGLAGGSLVVAGGYAWYHLSGTRTVVQTAQEAIFAVRGVTTGKTLSNLSSSDVATLSIALLRYLTKTFAPFPGDDMVFDQLHKAAERHGDKVVDVLKNTLQGLHEVTSNLKGAADSGEKVKNVLTRGLQDLQNISAHAASDTFGRMLDQSPRLKPDLNASYENLKSTVAKHGPEAQRMASGTYSRLTQLFSKRADSSSIKDARTILQDTSQKISQVATRAREGSWRDSTRPVDERLVEFKIALYENLVSLGVLDNDVQDSLSRLRAFQNSGETVRVDVKEFNQPTLGDEKLGRILNDKELLVRLESTKMKDQVNHFLEMKKYWAEELGPDVEKYRHETRSNAKNASEIKQPEKSRGDAVEETEHRGTRH